MIVKLKKGFYFTFLASKNVEFDNMCRDLISITQHTQYEKKECTQFIKKITKYRKKAQNINSSFDDYLNHCSMYNIYPTRMCKYEKKLVNLDWNVQQLILKYFFKSGRKYILKQILLQENDWKYLICFNNKEKLLNDFLNSLNVDEQIDIYLLIATTYNNKDYQHYVASTTYNKVLPSYEDCFCFICKNNIELAINLLSHNFNNEVEKKFNGVTIGIKEYNSIITKFFEAKYYYTNYPEIQYPINWGESIIETQLSILSMANAQQRLSILSSISNFEILNLFYSCELQGIEDELKDTISANLHEIFDHINTAEKETAYLSYYTLCFDAYIELLKKVRLDEKLDILSVLNHEQLSKVVDKISIKKSKN